MDRDDTIELLWNSNFDLKQFVGDGQAERLTSAGDAAYRALSAELAEFDDGPAFGAAGPGLMAAAEEFEEEEPEVAPAVPAHVRVLLPDDSVVHVGLGPADTVADLLRAVCGRPDVTLAPKEVLVLVEGHEVRDEWRCVDCGITKGKSVGLKLRSGAQGDQQAAVRGDWAARVRPEEAAFHRALQQYRQGTGDALHLLESFRSICAERKDELLHEASAHGRRREREQATMLRQERDTWHLLADLHRLREEGAPPPPPPVSGATQPEQAMLARLHSDPQLRLHERVVRWSEAIAAEAVTFEDEESDMWPRTLKALAGPLRSADLVRGLDPDATLRGGGVLQREDEEAEASLARSVWQFVRAGKLAEAMELCVRRGQPWRAASLAGGRPVSLVPAEAEAEAEAEDDNAAAAADWVRVGNPHRESWKATCWELSEASSRGATAVAAYESATYALLSNNLDRLLQSRLCQTWEDQIWAYFRCSVDRAIDESLAEHRRVQLMASAYHPGPESDRHVQRNLQRTAKLEGLTAQGVFTAVAASGSALARDGSEDAQHKVQAAVIEGRLVELVSHVIKPAVLDATPSEARPLFLRFAAHLALYLAEVAPELPPPARPDPEELYVIICAYVQHLAAAKAVPQVALYVSRLPSHLRVPLYSSFLERITREDERALSLRLAEDLFPEDVATITKRVVEAIRSRPEGDAQPPAGEGLSPDDEERVQGLRWLCFDDKHRAQAVAQGNALIRAFVGAPGGCKLEASQRVLQLLPPQAVDAVQRVPQTLGAAAARRAVRELACWRVFVEAHAAYVAWRALMASSHVAPAAQRPQPGPDGNISAAMDYVQRVAGHGAQAQEQVAAMTASAHAAQRKLIEALSFEGGWLQPLPPAASAGSDSESEPMDTDDEDEDEDEDEAARADPQLAGLRRLCVPQLLFMLHRVLYDSGNWALGFNTPGLAQHALRCFRESLNLAELVASEEHRLYLALGRDELAQFMRLCHKSSAAVLRLQGRL